MKTRCLTMILVGLLAVPAVGSAQDAAKKTDSGATKSAGRPIMDIPRMTYDFGETFELPEYAFTFIVRNRGDADLIIEEVKPGCGCTAAKFDKVIAPGK